jgi:glycosyltransferase involved in cell wall biosynthesis
MIEALACGTPVIALSRGAVSEVVKPATGYICKNIEEMAAAVYRVHEIDRAECRRDVLSRFSESVMVDKYEAVAREALRNSRQQ